MPVFHHLICHICLGFNIITKNIINNSSKTNSIMAMRRKTPWHACQQLKVMFLQLLLVLVIGVNTASAVYCRAGHHYDRKNQDCHACQAGTFMPHDSHQFTTCKRCSQPESHLHEIVAKDCTSTTDTVIRCTDGYFWHSGGDPHKHRGSCTRCTSCEAEGKLLVEACSELHDAICCPEPGMKIANKRNIYGGPVCKFIDAEETSEEGPPDDSEVIELGDPNSEKSCTGTHRIGGCIKNERMVSYNDGNEALCCEPCPKDTFVAESSHTNSVCLSCWNEGKLHPECGGEVIEPKEEEKNDDLLPPQAEDNDSTKKDDDDSELVIIIVSVVASVLVVSCVVLLIICCRYRFKRLGQGSHAIVLKRNQEGIKTEEHEKGSDAVNEDV